MRESEHQTSTSTSSKVSEVHGDSVHFESYLLYDHLKHAAERHANEPAITACHERQETYSKKEESSLTHAQGLTWSYRQLWELSGRFANGLISRGCSSSSTMAIFLRNQADWALAFWTAVQLGTTLVPMHPKILDSPAELEHQMRVSKPKIIIAADFDTAARLDKVAGGFFEDVDLKILAGQQLSGPGGWISTQEVLAEQSTCPAPTTHPDHVSLLYFTGGTTALPKAAPHTSRSTVVCCWAYANRWHVSPGRRIVGHAPSFHAYAVSTWITFWFAGGCVVYPDSTFSPDTVLSAIEQQRCTDISGTPAIVDSLVKHPSASHMQLDSLLHVNLGGDIVGPDVLARCHAPPLRAKHVTIAFGMAEAGVLTLWDLHEAELPLYEGVASVGTIAPNSKLRICPPDSRQPVPWGQIGELHFGSDFIYQGFPGREEDWLYAEGKTKWIRTGDQAMLGTKGQLYILGRYKDIIIRGGSNISPLAVENAIRTLPGVDAHVVGVPDEIAGQVPVAVVSHSGGSSHTNEEICLVVTDRLGQAFTPQRVFRLHELGLQHAPNTKAGKVDKKALVKLVTQHMNSEQEKTSSLSSPETLSSSTDQTRDILKGIWARFSARDPGDISSTQPITDFADSLLILQASSLIEKRTSKRITPENILLNPTIDQQVQLLSSRSAKTAENHTYTTSSHELRNATEVVHVANDSAAFEGIREAVTKQLSKWGLGWDIVEDIMPVHDTNRFLLKSVQRLQSWNYRFAFVATSTPEEMRRHLIDSLKSHTMFRSVIVKDNKNTWLHAVLRLTQQIADWLVTTQDKPMSENEFLSHKYNDLEWDQTLYTEGSLFKARIVPLQGEKQVGVVMNTNHCMNDVISTSLWLHDLRLLIDGQASQIPARIPYKTWADAYHHGRDGIVAQNSCDYFVRKLQGLSADQKALWPIQKERGWMQGECLEWSDASGHRAGAAERTFVDPPGERLGHRGHGTTLQVSDELQKQHGISAVALFKAAIATFNVHKTGADYAVFSQWESARMFPFLDDNATYEAMLPNAMDVAGPHGQQIVDKTDVSAKDTILDLLLRIQKDLTSASHHAHAPMYEIGRKLEENESSSTAKQDKEAFFSTLNRQALNWVPYIPDLFGPEADKTTRTVQGVGRSDFGLVWTGIRTAKGDIDFSVLWDDAQLGWKETKEALNETVASVRWMSEANNLSRTVGDWWQECAQRIERETSTETGHSKWGNTLA